MPPNPREVLAAAARELLSSLAELPEPPTTRVADAQGRIACLILVWDADGEMPSANGERRRRIVGGRKGCRDDILELITAAGRPMTRKEVSSALKAAKKKHGASTIAKALAELTASEELVNPRDNKGYRPGGWKRAASPSLF